jgi:hypothetical protein
MKNLENDHRWTSAEEVPKQIVWWAVDLSIVMSRQPDLLVRGAERAKTYQHPHGEEFEKYKRRR